MKFIVGMILGFYIAWFCDNKALQRYRDEIVELRKKLKMWTMRGDG